MEAARDAQGERGALLVRLEDEKEELGESARDLSCRHTEEVS